MTRAGVAATAKWAGILRPLLRSGLLAWLCAFAITVQCIVVQGHIHSPLAPGEIASVDHSAAPQATPSPVKDQTPGDRSRDGCFICQQMMMAGAGVLPVTPVPVLIERELTLTPPPVEVAIVASQTSHIWRSRAPPLSLKV
jgi:hypothetical protein